jgi:hypothetical protein
MGPSNQSVAQGQDYLRIHAGQHGGAAPYAGAPVGYTGVLDSSLREAARIQPLDQSLSKIQGMSDQSGGGKKRKSYMNRVRNIMKRLKRFVTRKGKGSKRSKRQGGGAKKGSKRKSYMNRVRNVVKRLKRFVTRRGRKGSKRGSRRMRGGNVPMVPANYGAPGTLLSPSMESKAVSMMNPEWKLAADPQAFAPKMA